jgi:tRNA A-37 threonylcarbamoyl transferase component Bud32
LPPLPRTLIFRKTYDFFEGVSENFRSFLEKSLNFSDFPDGAEIITTQKLLDPRGHVTEGRLGSRKIVLKRSKAPSDAEQNDRQFFYAFMDALKEKLNECAAIENDQPFFDEEKNLSPRPLLGLGNITPIVGISKIFSTRSRPREIIEVLPKIRGHTLHECVERKFPPYDTPLGSPRNQGIAIDLLSQLTRAHLTLHTCGYIYKDSNPKNIMISDHGSFFALKLIDWGSLEKIKDPSNVINDKYKLTRVFISILLGKPYSPRQYLPKYLKNFFKNFETLRANVFRKKCLHLLNKAGIYSKKVATALAELLFDMIFPKGKNTLDLEIVLSRLEQLPIDGEGNGSEEAKSNETNAIDGDENELGESQMKESEAAGEEKAIR